MVPTAEHYDVVVIGGGPGGYASALYGASAGLRIALVEKRWLGGTCLNYGCDPTKTLLDVARRRHEALDGERFGLDIPTAEADWPAIQVHVTAVLRTIRGGSPAQARARMERRKNLDLVMGEARFLSSHDVKVGRRTLRADQILIATGSEAIVPPIEGLEEAGYLTNRTLFDIPALPERLAVIGAGPVGIEFAQLFAPKIIAELRGRLEPDGTSPFWEGLGRHFFAMEYSTADYLTGLGQKSFIAELMPRHPVYVDLLPLAAREAIGAVHADTAPARAMLEQEGFRYEGYVDIFDGGPTMTARTDDVRSVREARPGTVTSVNLDIGDRALLATGTLGTFRAAFGMRDIHPDGSVEIDHRSAALLGVSTGDEVWSVLR